MSNKTTVAFLLPYPIGKAPSQRFRVELFEPVLKQANIQYTYYPFWSKKTWEILYKPGHRVAKALGLLKGFLNRWRVVLFKVPFADYVFIHREAAPLGPPVFEWIIAKVFRKKIIFDFDDAIWIPNTSAENKSARLLKAFWKVGYICKWAHKVAAGNDFLCAYAQSQGNKAVVRIPTIVNTATRYNKLKEHTDGKVTIGWTGSHSTLKFLDDIIPVLQKLQETHDFHFVVIADKQPAFTLKDWAFIPWNPASEIDDLLQIDIGIMPLTPDPWSEGKCGFKLIQYLALGIPALASPVGVNQVIIEQNVNGFLCSNDTDWEQALVLLLKDAKLRAAMGTKGREKMVKEYSLQSIRQPFLNLFSS